MLAEYLVGRRKQLDWSIAKASKYSQVNVAEVERGEGDEQQLVKLLNFYDNIFGLFKKIDADNLRVLATIKPEVKFVDNTFKIPSLTPTVFNTLKEVHDFLQEYNNNVLRSWL